MTNNIAIITDSHFGIKKANDLFLDSQLKFFKEQFEPSLKRNGIKEIFFLGDVFDNRVSMNIKIKNAVLDIFENILGAYKIYLLIGNHDSYYTNTIETNALKFLDKLNNVTVIDKPHLVEVKGRKIYLVPWIVSDKAFLNELSNLKDKVDICMGHFAINGFHLNKYRIEDGGLTPEHFFKFPMVFSGHLHARGVKKFDGCEIVYVGSPYQLTRADCGEPRGYCILNMETLEYKFINNDVSLEYVLLDYPAKFTKKMIEGNIVDVNVKFDKTIDDNKLQLYIKMIENFNPIVPPVIVPINSFMNGPDTVGDFEVKSASDLMREYIDKLDIDNKDEIYVTLEKLYEEARNTL